MTLLISLSTNMDFLDQFKPVMLVYSIIFYFILIPWLKFPEDDLLLREQYTTHLSWIYSFHLEIFSKSDLSWLCNPFSIIHTYIHACMHTHIHMLFYNSKRMSRSIFERYDLMISSPSNSHWFIGSKVKSN